MTLSQALLAERVPVARREPEALVHRECAVDDGGAARLGPPSLERLRGHAIDHTLAWWAVRYLTTKVCGVQSVNTLEAKARDLDGFVRWLIATHGGAAVDTWLPRDSRAYLTELERQGRAPPTINRALSSLRHMARWVHDQPGAVFARTGLPTEGIRELAVDEPTRASSTVPKSSSSLRRQKPWCSPKPARTLGRAATGPSWHCFCAPGCGSASSWGFGANNSTGSIFSM